MIQQEPSPHRIRDFQGRVHDYYARYGRDLPWRKTTDRYFILVSEIMLQQTTVPRVIPKFREFCRTFPTIDILAQATLGDVLRLWSGLGYNRRAKYLLQTAQNIQQNFGGVVPDQVHTLRQLPGIGEQTARAILVYADNRPLPFIETNIRSVYVHEFFHGQVRVSDSKLMPLIEATLDTSQPRVWYNALMDYGAMIKVVYKNPSRHSRHYTKQSPFLGSDRQIRGKIVQRLTLTPMTLNQLSEGVPANQPRVKKIVMVLIAEGLLKQSGKLYSLP